MSIDRSGFSDDIPYGCIASSSKIVQRSPDARLAESDESNNDDLEKDRAIHGLHTLKYHDELLPANSSRSTRRRDNTDNRSCLSIALPSYSAEPSLYSKHVKSHGECDMTEFCDTLNPTSPLKRRSCALRVLELLSISTMLGRVTLLVMYESRIRGDLDPTPHSEPGDESREIDKLRKLRKCGLLD